MVDQIQNLDGHEDRSQEQTIEDLVNLLRKKDKITRKDLLSLEEFANVKEVKEVLDSRHLTTKQKLWKIAKVAIPIIGLIGAGYAAHKTVKWFVPPQFWKYFAVVSAITVAGALYHPRETVIDLKDDYVTYFSVEGERYKNLYSVIPTQKDQLNLFRDEQYHVRQRISSMKEDTLESTILSQLDQKKQRYEALDKENKALGDSLSALGGTKMTIVR
jgi:hypothetical protein